MNVNTPGAAGRKKIKVKMVLAIIFALVLLYFSLMYGQKQNIVSLFPTENQILTFSNKTVSAQKGNESSELNVELIENPELSPAKKTNIYRYNMPFKTEKDFIPRNEETDLKWYNIIETVPNKWTFVNCINEHNSSMFDISYYPDKKSLQTTNLRTSEEYIVGFITGYDSKDKYFVTDTGCFYDINGKSLNNSETIEGFLEANDSVDKNMGLDLLSSAVCYMNHDNIVFYKCFMGSHYTFLTKITRDNGEIFNQQHNPAEKVTVSHKSGKESHFKTLSFKTGRLVHIKSLYNSYAPMTVSPDRKKLAFVTLYGNCSQFGQSDNSLSYMKSYQGAFSYLWLVVWDTEKNEIHKIITIPSATTIKPMPFTMLWCPANGSPLISFYCLDGLFIIDTSKQTIKKVSEKNNCDIIRWSPDGSMLGFLDCYGSLNVYDVTKDKIIEINSDKDCFNFVWVK